MVTLVTSARMTSKDNQPDHFKPSIKNGQDQLTHGRHRTHANTISINRLDGDGAMDIRSTLTELCEAFNAHDLDRIMAFFSDDCVLEMPREASLGVLVSRDRPASLQS